MTPERLLSLTNVSTRRNGAKKSMDAVEALSALERARTTCSLVTVELRNGQKHFGNINQHETKPKTYRIVVGRHHHTYEFSVADVVSVQHKYGWIDGRLRDLYFR